MEKKSKKSNDSLMIFIKSTPYSSENSFVALSNALVDFYDNLNIIFIFLFDGVWNLLTDQNSRFLSNFPNIEDLYKSIITDADFYVYSKSLKKRALLNSKLLPGVKVLDPKSLSRLILTNGQNILFF